MTTIHPSASDESFAELGRDPFFEVVVDLIADYLADAFDDPAGGEVDRWTLSALPATNRTPERERLFTLNVGPMQVLYVERFLEGDDIVDYRVALYVSRSALIATIGCAAEDLVLRYPLLRFAGTGLASAGGDGLVIDWFVSDEGADDQFFALPLAESIRPLAQHLAAQGRGPYAQFHNRAFASHVLGRVGTDA
ncbi:hypothetical protein ACFWPA_13250 [Rhodococcus sp. NPDC058505]|uniref:hypothetical protein n=1 Tax=unclassified Rhodococcus (in: high G+C Gram-positive bacteria) TaxID=192944 RepID=UPI00366419B8